MRFDTRKKYIELFRKFELENGRSPSQAEFARVVGVSRAYICNIAPHMSVKFYNGSATLVDETDRKIKEAIETLTMREDLVTVKAIFARTGVSPTTIRRCVARCELEDLID